ncbi:hypothetical protein J6590_018968 [Homalodisca vitripennis]|nr:hypothetical protein J6590_018968 [Homalodisca vitripennis]
MDEPQTISARRYNHYPRESDLMCQGPLAGVTEDLEDLTRRLPSWTSLPIPKRPRLLFVAEGTPLDPKTRCSTLKLPTPNLSITVRASTLYLLAFSRATAATYGHVDHQGGISCYNDEIRPEWFGNDGTPSPVGLASLDRINDAVVTRYYRPSTCRAFAHYMPENVVNRRFPCKTFMRRKDVSPNFDQLSLRLQSLVAELILTETSRPLALASQTGEGEKISVTESRLNATTSSSRGAQLRPRAAAESDARHQPEGHPTQTAAPGRPTSRGRPTRGTPRPSSALRIREQVEHSPNQRPQESIQFPKGDQTRWSNFSFCIGFRESLEHLVAAFLMEEQSLELLSPRCTVNKAPKYEKGSSIPKLRSMTRSRSLRPSLNEKATTLRNRQLYVKSGHNALVSKRPTSLDFGDGLPVPSLKRHPSIANSPQISDLENLGYRVKGGKDTLGDVLDCPLLLSRLNKLNGVNGLREILGPTPHSHNRRRRRFSNVGPRRSPLGDSLTHRGVGKDGKCGGRSLTGVVGADPGGDLLKPNVLKASASFFPPPGADITL